MMDLANYLATTTFARPNNQGLDLTPLNRKDDLEPVKIDLPYEHYCEQFGDQLAPKNTAKHHGALAIKYPQVFQPNVIKKLFPTTCEVYARYLLALSLMNRHIAHYQAPRYDNDGFPDFCESDGYALAKQLRRRYVVMEDLS